MKKNVLRAAFVVTLGLAAGFTTYSSQKDELALSDVVLDYVEALASGNITKKYGIVIIDRKMTVITVSKEEVKLVE
jgi:hypothetical protein